VVVVHGGVLPAVITRLAAVCEGAEAKGGEGTGAGAGAGAVEAGVGAGVEAVDGAEALEGLLADRSVRGILSQGGDALNALMASLAKLQAAQAAAAGIGEVCGGGAKSGGGTAGRSRITARALSSLQRQCDVLAAVVDAQARMDS
jgi:hypothetical protein